MGKLMTRLSMNGREQSELTSLTESQQRAVAHRDGPLLVLAGPGSGKTRVITQRIGRMIETGISARNILAITFTNKAAKEMASRVEAIVPNAQPWVGTFHRFCAFLLRRYANMVGLSPGFSIFDTADQKQLIRQVLHEQDLDTVHCPPAKVAARISRAKNDLLLPEDYARQFSESVGDHLQAATARVYPAYQKWLLESNAVDFDDLLLHVVRLLSENDELRAELDSRYSHILVDEYQDTNLAQYQIVRALSCDRANLCATGDPDQSIYSWRGANIDNILKFESDFPNATVVRLEENFRSTQRILYSADSLIAHNQRRKLKSLVTNNAEGEPVELLLFNDGRQEANEIAQQMRHAVDNDGLRWSDIAIFYRMNSFSRELELALSRHRIPYQVAQGVAFYNRAEIKDLLCYLRLVHNPLDRAAFLRVVNTPARAIGKKTQNRVAEFAANNSIGLLDAAMRAEEIPGLSKRAIKAVQRFAEMMRGFSLVDSGSVEGLLQEIVQTTRYADAWTGSESEQDQNRLANVNELVNAAHEYDLANGDDTSLEGFLEATSLAGEVDRIDESKGAVTLMTLHAAKGLEFPVVYVVGVEQGVIPHERSINSGDYWQIEEERRLLFVGMTRAERRLSLTHTRKRLVRGRDLPTIRSEFLAETDFVEVDCTLIDSDEGQFWRDTATDKSTRQQLDNKNSLGNLTKSKRLASQFSGLTTGAALLNGSPESVEVPQGFSVGMTVRHPRYGLGTVMELGGFSKHRTVTVTFRDSGEKETFVASKCPLQPVGLR